MKYTLPTNGSARTSDYQGTTNDYTNDEDVANLKKSVSIHNNGVRETSRRIGRICGVLGRVRVKPRGPRSSSWYHTLVEEATHFDIYAGEDTEAMHQLRREIDTGLTPGELRKLNKLQGEARMLELKGVIRKRKRNNDLPFKY